jgi:hypothetical protein
MTDVFEKFNATTATHITSVAETPINIPEIAPPPAPMQPVRIDINQKQMRKSVRRVENCFGFTEEFYTQAYPSRWHAKKWLEYMEFVEQPDGYFLSHSTYRADIVEIEVTDPRDIWNPVNPRTSEID